MFNKLKSGKNILTILSVCFIAATFIFLVIRLETACESLGSIKTELTQVKKEFGEYKTLVQKINDIDIKFTQELTSAKNENNRLYDNVINGLGRLQFNVNKATSTSLDDAKACELAGEARQNYHLLRDDIIVKDKMIQGLQEYINNVCLAD